MNDNDYNMILSEWSGSVKNLDFEKSVVEVFTQQALKMPDAIAITFGNKKITYRELNDLSDKVAGYLVNDCGIKTGDFAGILLDRSENMIIAILGILKSGAAYVSIDPDYPNNRKKFIVEDTALSVLITQTEYLFDLEFYNGHLFAIDVQLSALEDKDILPYSIDPDATAYVIYTSGTSGKPKGVMISHRAVLSLIRNNYLSLLPTDSFAFFSSPVFDATTFEIYTPLLNGLQLIIPQDTKALFSNVKLLKSFLSENRVTVLWLTKTLFENLFYLDETLFQDLNYLIVGGEALDKATVNKMVSNPFKPKKFLNGYGPTESTTFTCTHDLIEPVETANVPIGKPIENRKVYVVDETMKPVGVGVPGELYIGGPGLAKGYLNNPELTSQRFVPNPFSDANATYNCRVLYKTGDIVRWLANGSIEFLGRNDEQVKIRGYRIELGEIESALTDMQDIQQACVIVREKSLGNVSNKYLVAYLVSPLKELSEEKIIQALAKILPDYMIPAVYVQMETLPVTINGKLDKSALPEPDDNVSDINYTAPVSEEEIQTCRIWQEVLSLKQVGIHDEFFRIGGNSILAIQVSHRMSRTLNSEITVTDLFKYKTVSELLKHTLGKKPVHIPQKDKTVPSVLSFAQERLWFIEQFEQGTHAYHIPELFEIHPDTSIELLKKAIHKIIWRHEVLRSTIEQVNDQKEPVQMVHEEALHIEEAQLSAAIDYTAQIKADIRKPFDLTKEYPIRVKFYHITSGQTITKTILLINTHHIASDRWSMGVFMDELLASYEAYSNSSEACELQPPDIQYKDYALWQKINFTNHTLEKQIGYWKQKLQGHQLLEFPADYPRPLSVDYKGHSISFKLDKKISDELKSIAMRRGATLNSLLSAALGILLGKYTGQNDIVIGNPIANRQYRQTEGLIGFFANTQVCRLLLNAAETFEDLIEQVHQSQVEAQFNQDLPFEKLVNELQLDRDLSRHPIFQVMLVTQSIPDFYEALARQKEYLNPLPVEDYYSVERFDMTVFIDDIGEELRGAVSYATSLFKQETIEKFVKHLEYLFRDLAGSPDKPFREFSLLTKSEHAQIVYQWNKTETPFAKNKTIHSLFEDRVSLDGEKTALVYQGISISYNELNERSNQVALHLQKQFLKKTAQSFRPDTLIAVYFDRSPNLIISIIGILKAGGAYVPVDPKYPQSRIDYILQDTAAEFVLTDHDTYKRNLKEIPKDKAIFVDTLQETIDKINLPENASGENLAYVIYTSGTTGKPKGVMIEHRSVVNYTNNVHRLLMSEAEHVDFSSNIAFDLTVTTTLCALLSGKKIFIYDGELSNLDQYAKHLSECKIDFLKSTPSVLSNLPLGNLGGHVIRQAMIGGEKLEEFHLSKICRYIEKPFDEYGPTEATVGTTVILKSDIHETKNLIGKPYGNCRVYVLDNNLQPVPVGMKGELYIGGTCLARGYLNLPGLTNDKFISDPFVPGERMYKTGDLVKWKVNGNLGYIGRNDSQIKIRGYRIELSEIEENLQAIEGIQSACVTLSERIIHNDTIKQLNAYCILEDNVQLNASEIQAKLSSVIPEYMIPDFVIILDEFPLTYNGKLDKNALPAPDFRQDEASYKAPIGLTESILCEVYSEVLGLPKEKISTEQSFFKMGGNSLLSIHLKNRLNQVEGFEDISVADLFRYNSVRKLVESRTGSTKEFNINNYTRKTDDHDVAIIAMSGAFSGARTISELWQMIAEQREGIRMYSRKECAEKGIEKTMLDNPDFVPAAGLVDDIDLFDPAFWGLSPNESRQIDPQIRKFAEHCWYALESAGYSDQRKQLKVGVFAGSGYSSYYSENILNGEASEQIDIWEAYNSNSKDALATKTAFLLGLTGPANSINTACSTGLVSVIEACQKLELGACDMALAGGVSLILPEKLGHIFREGMILSKDGHCKTFDNDATGTVAGSGVGVVLLKRLEDAIKDKDPIVGVIKGYCINNDGDRKSGYTAPSVLGQSECIINAQRHANVLSDDISYVECHGTATKLGDPIEVLALKEAFSYNKNTSYDSKDPVILGSVKANIGHADSAAGTAGLIKVCSMLQNKLIPGQVNFTNLNTEIRLDQTNFKISEKSKPWTTGQQKTRLAGVSSFGIGGTNAHVIVGEYLDPGDDHRLKYPELEKKSYIIPFSAKSRLSLQNYRDALLDYLKKNSAEENKLSLKSIAYTLQERRAQFNYRSAFAADSVPELIRQLEGEFTFGQVINEKRENVVFMFPGQGVQYPDMAKELYTHEKYFKDTFDLCIRIANKYLENDLLKIIFPKKTGSSHNINDIEWSAISLFVIEYSFAKYLEHLGVRAKAYIGHSFGEYAAATLAGVFDLEDAIRIVIRRGKIMQAAKAGAMLSVNAKLSSVENIIRSNDCDVAVINSEEDIVASGEIRSIDKLQKCLEDMAIPVVRINGTVAGHSRLMDQAMEQFRKEFEKIKLSQPSGIFAANLTGEIANENVTSSEYWCNHLRQTVQFGKGVNTLAKYFNHEVSFVEVAPGRGLSYFINKYSKSKGYQSVQSVSILPSGKDISPEEGSKTNLIRTKQDVLMRLWINGLIEKPNHPDEFNEVKVNPDLPLYQFAFQKCWINKREKKQGDLHPVNDMFYKRSWERMDIGRSSEKVFKKVTVLINNLESKEQKLLELLNAFQKKYPDLNFIAHKKNTHYVAQGFMDFTDPKHVRAFFDEISENTDPELVIYLSAGTVVNDPSLDILAVRNIFDWSKHTGKKIQKFVSVSIDDYDITGNELLSPMPSIIYGVTKSIPFEYFSSGVEILHCDLSSADSEYSLLYALIGRKSDKDLFAIRGKNIWSPVYHRLKCSTDSQEESRSPLEGAVHLITGGLGGVGYAYANRLAASAEKRILILLGRTEESALRKDYRKRLEALRQTHHTIIYEALDISTDDSRIKIEKILRQHGCTVIHSVLHSAGIGAKSALQEKTASDIEPIVRTKINGLINLLKIGKLFSIEKLICCSSISSIIPSIGNMEYTAANLFLDEMAYRQTSGIDRILTINLNQVSDTGMLLDFLDQLTAKHGPSSNSIKSNDFPEIVTLLLQNTQRGNVILSRLDFSAELEDSKANMDRQKKDTKPASAIKIIEDDHAPEESKIARLFAETLGIEQISVHDDFFKLGGNSILAIRVAHRLNDLLKKEIRIADIFKHKTSRNLGAALSNKEESENIVTEKWTI